MRVPGLKEALCGWEFLRTLVGVLVTIPCRESCSTWVRLKSEAAQHRGPVIRQQTQGKSCPFRSLCNFSPVFFSNNDACGSWMALFPHSPWPTAGTARLLASPANSCFHREHKTVWALAAVRGREESKRYLSLLSPSPPRLSLLRIRRKKFSPDANNRSLHTKIWKKSCVCFP